MNHKLERYSDDKLPAFSSVGGYPLFYLDGENSVLCANCANASDSDPEELDNFKPVACGVNWEDLDLHCDGCSARIDSAYADNEDAVCDS